LSNFDLLLRILKEYSSELILSLGTYAIGISIYFYKLVQRIAIMETRYENFKTELTESKTQHNEDVKRIEGLIRKETTDLEESINAKIKSFEQNISNTIKLIIDHQEKQTNIIKERFDDLKEYINKAI